MVVDFWVDGSVCCKSGGVFLNSVRFQFFRRPADIALHEVQKTFIISFIGKAGNDTLHSYRLAEVDRAFDVLVNEPFDLDDLIIDLKGEGVILFDPGTFFPCPLIMPYFDFCLVSIMFQI